MLNYIIIIQEAPHMRCFLMPELNFEAKLPGVIRYAYHRFPGNSRWNRIFMSGQINPGGRASVQK